MRPTAADRRRSVVCVMSVSYNNTHHRSIGMAPMEVTADNEGVVRKRLYPPKPKTLIQRVTAGKVRSIQCITFVSKHLPGSTEQRVEPSHVQ